MNNSVKFKVYSLKFKEFKEMLRCGRGLRLMLLAALLLCGLTAQAQQYVFLYKNGNTIYFMYNNSGAVGRRTDFDSSSCVFAGTGTSTSTFTNGTNSLNRNTNTLRFNTASTWVITTYGRVYYDANTDRYIYYNNGWTALSSTNSPGTGVAYTVLFTYSNYNATLTNPTITGADVLTATGTSDYSVAAKATVRYHKFDGYSGTTATSYYWYSSALQTAPPTETNVTSGTWVLEGGSTYASVNSSTGRITVSSLPPTDIEMTLKCTVTSNGVTKTAQKTVTLNGTVPTAPTITRTGNDITLATSSMNATIYYTTDGSTPSSSSTAYTGSFSIEDLDYPVTVKAIAIRNGNSSTVATQTYSQPKCATPVISIASDGAVTITCATEGATIRYLKGDSNPADPTESTGTVGTSTTLTNLQYIKAIAVKSGYDNSEVASDQYVITGVAGSKVILDDREDHSWSYYSDATCPIRSLNPADVKITYYGNGTNNVNVTTNSTTPGNNDWTSSASSVQVSTSETANTFIYYKTLERYDGSSSNSPTGRCAYTAIPNPFSKRPSFTISATKYYTGFYKWRVKALSGGTIYDAATGGNSIGVGSTIDGEQTIYFAPSSEYGMEVELEALWARAYTTTNTNTLSTYVTGTNAYERNFNICTSAQTASNIQKSYPLTISSVYPDGTNGGGSISGGFSAAADTKFENISVTGATNSTWLANGHDLIIGRGMNITNYVNTIQGVESAANYTAQSYGASSYTIRIESGTFYNLLLTAGSYNTSYMVKFTSTLAVKCVIGCDYDRASGDNSKLSITPSGSSGSIYGGKALQFTGSSNRNNLTFDWYIKSGKIHDGLLGTADGGDESIYLGSSHYGSAAADLMYFGRRRLTVEGGDIASIAGGVDDITNNNVNVSDGGWTTLIRVKGGTLRGSVYGAAAYSGARGDRLFVFTKGTVKGWIAGGANGTQSDGGLLTGTSYLYIGGETSVNSNESHTVINRAIGGNVFGAGCGYSTSSSSGQVSDGTNVVVADNAYIERGVYGGGSYGYTESTANLYIIGGTIDGKTGGVDGESYSNSIVGGVFGGACQNKGGTVNITMTGGNVHSGLYGGSNANGTVTGPVTMHIDGGQVGTTSANANIHGGGYGQATTVSGNVDLNMGTCGAASGVTVYGDVYGGSALGTVNTDANNTTTVNLYKGTIYGGLYGGALGQVTPSSIAAAVNGAVTVNVYGGSVLCSASDPQGEAGTGSVFGCNNINGAPQSTVTVDIYNTDQPLSGYALHAVYGGGNKSAYNGTPVVTVHGCNNSIEYVYGGGNAADVAGTNVTIWGGNIGNVFGGGNGYSAAEPPNHSNPSGEHYNPGANITANGTYLKIYGGTIGAAFGGSNQYGTINSTITIDVEERAETGLDACDNELNGCGEAIIELYGGGNEAPIQTSGGSWIVPTINLDCSANVGMLFGGAKAADYTGNINLVVDGGTYEKVFGGNNKGGTITGNVTVTFNGGSAGEVYGGCNENGTITGTVIVNIDSTTNSCDPHFYVENVYGGGNLAAYSHAADNYPQVNIINGTVRNSVYGGGYGEDAVVTGNPIVTIGGTNGAASATGKKASVWGNVFGGGNAAAIVGSTDVRVIKNSTVGGNVFGGGNAAAIQKNEDVGGNTQVWLKDKARVYGAVYGGGNMGEVGGNTKVIVDSE